MGSGGRCKLLLIEESLQVTGSHPLGDSALLGLRGFLLSLSYPGEEGHILYSLLPPEPTSLTIQAFSKKKEDEPYRGVLSRFIAAPSVHLGFPVIQLIPNNLRRASEMRRKILLLRGSEEVTKEDMLDFTRMYTKRYLRGAEYVIYKDGVGQVRGTLQNGWPSRLLASMQKRIRQARSHSSCWGRCSFPLFVASTLVGFRLCIGAWVHGPKAPSYVSFSELQHSNLWFSGCCSFRLSLHSDLASLDYVPPRGIRQGFLNLCQNPFPVIPIKIPGVRDFCKSISTQSLAKDLFFSLAVCSSNWIGLPTRLAKE
ncbi:hypothetical protein LguiA_035863 [Lonicera macranthoides]